MPRRRALPYLAACPMSCWIYSASSLESWCHILTRVRLITPGGNLCEDVGSIGAFILRSVPSRQARKALMRPIRALVGVGGVGGGGTERPRSSAVSASAAAVAPYGGSASRLVTTQLAADSAPLLMVAGGGGGGLDVRARQSSGLGEAAGAACGEAGGEGEDVRRRGRGAYAAYLQTAGERERTGWSDSRSRAGAARTRPTPHGSAAVSMAVLRTAPTPPRLHVTPPGGQAPVAAEAKGTAGAAAGAEPAGSSPGPGPGPGPGPAAAAAPPAPASASAPAPAAADGGVYAIRTVRAHRPSEPAAEPAEPGSGPAEAVATVGGAVGGAVGAVGEGGAASKGSSGGAEPAAAAVGGEERLPPAELVGRTWLRQAASPALHLACQACQACLACCGVHVPPRAPAVFTSLAGPRARAAPGRRPGSCRRAAGRAQPAAPGGWRGGRRRRAERGAAE